MRGRIIRSAKRTFTCHLEQNEQQREIEAAAHAVLLKDFHLVVGDEVEIEQGESGEEQFVISQVLPRRTEVTRFIPRTRERKVIASNIDLQVIVASVSRPTYKPGLVDRYLVRGSQWGIPSIVVFNKIDEWDGLPHPDFDLNFELAKLQSIGVSTYLTSAYGQGLPELKAALTHKCSIFSGQSGVGKSKLISALAQGKIELLSGELGSVGKGAHTTSWSEWIDLGAFSVVDSPGIRSFSLEDLIPEDLDDLFPDLQELFLRCQFRNCQHIPEAKGCAFYSDLSAQESELQRIWLARLASYQRLKEEVSRTPWWQKKSY